VSAEPVRWNAEDPEGGAAQVGGHPVHVWWARLRGAFRAVLLEPHRRAGGGTVGWRWRAPDNAPSPSTADLAVLRRRLGGALLDFSDELERADAGTGDLHAAMHDVVEDLVRSSDARFSAYVVPTENGWMIRSWGFAQPSAAMPENVDETTTFAPVKGAPKNVVAAQPRSRRKRRLGWGAIIAGVIVLMLIAVWRLKDRRDEMESVTAERVADVAPAPAIAGKKKLKTTEPIQRAPIRAVDSGLTRPDNVSGSPMSQRPLSTGTAGGGSFSADLVAAPVPAAFTGVMPVSAEAKGDRAGPESKLADEPEPGIAVALPDGMAVESNPVPKKPRNGSSTKAQPRDAGAPEETTDAAKNESKLAEAANGLSSPAHAAPKRTPPPDGAGSEVEARKQLSTEALLAPDGGQRVSHPELLPADADADIGNTVGTPSKIMPQIPKPPETKTVVLTNIVPQGDSEPSELSVTAKVTTGVWRVVRVRDVMLETWPTERPPNVAALKTARAQALVAARAEMPVSFQMPVVRQGWRLHLAPAAWLPTPPRWRDAVGGRFRMEREEVIESGWMAVEVRSGMDARLVAADGREFARVVASSDGRSASVHGAPEVLAVVPWVEVEIAEGESKAGHWVWRSLSAGWSGASWKTVHNEKTMSVCFPPGPGGKTGGILALVDDSSGWALACEWSADLPPEVNAVAEKQH
jgi:hypothetical protein